MDKEKHNNACRAFACKREQADSVVRNIKDLVEQADIEVGECHADDLSMLLQLCSALKNSVNHFASCVSEMRES